MILRLFIRPFALAAATALLAFCSAASAQMVLAGWDSFGLTNGGYPDDLAAEFSHESITASPLTRAAGLSSPGSIPHKWVGAAATRYTSMSASLAANNFFTFTLAPGAGTDLTISSLSFIPVGAGTRSINAFQWQYSVDGGAFVDFGAVTNTGSSTLGPITAIDGADFDVLSGSTVTFRLVAWAGGSITGPGNTIWGVGYDVNSVESSVSIFGMATSVVPEPASAAMVVGVVALGFGALRRRRA